MPEPAFIKDSQLRYVVVNQAYADLFNLSADDFSGMVDQEILPTEFDPFRDDQERRSVVFGEDVQLSLPDWSKQRSIPLIIERFIDDDDHIYLFGYCGHLLDAQMQGEGDGNTDGKGADLLKTLIESLPVATYIRDRNYRLLYANKAYSDITGLPLSALIGKTEIEIFPQLGEAYRDQNRRVVESNQSEECREVFINAAGEAIPVLSRSLPMTGPDGQVYLVGSITDLTQLRQREQLAEEAKEAAARLHVHFEGLLRELPVGALVLNEMLHIEYANPAVSRFLELEDFGPLEGLSVRALLEVVYRRSMAGSHGDEIEAAIEKRVNAYTTQGDIPTIKVKTPSHHVIAVSATRLDGGKILVTYSDITVLEEHEEQIELYRTALEQMPVPVFIRDHDRRLVFVNEAYEKLNRTPREAIYGLTEEEMFPDRGSQFREENERILRDGDFVENPRDVIVADGKLIPVMSRLSRITTRQKRHYLLGSLSDVSALREHEAALIEARSTSDKLYADLISILLNMPIGIVILTENLRVEFANEKCREIWCWRDDMPLEGLTFRDYCVENDKRGWTWPGLDFEEGYQLRVDEFKMLEGTRSRELSYPDGKSVLATATRLTEGRILLTYADLTEVRKRELEIDQARNELGRLGEFMQAAMRVMSQGLMVIEDNVVTHANESFSRILDLPPGVVTQGQTWLSAFHYCADRGDFGEEPAGLLKDWRAKLKETTGFTTTFLAGGKTWVQMEATFGGRGHWIVLLTDITDLKEREAELQVLLARSETADRAKSEFLANMSHEIRTPMNGVLGMAELLAKSALDTRQKTFVDIIMKSGNSLLTIINDILDFSKIDSGQMQLRQQPFDPVEAVEDVATLMAAAAAQKDIELIVRADAVVRHRVRGDAGRFRQIVTNLVGNAIKFTEIGQVFISLEAEERPDGRLSLRLMVEDTGVGIAQGQLQQIFEKFSQVDGSFSRRQEGTGLGLAITAGLVKLFGGTIDVTSSLGDGSIFAVEFPMEIVGERQGLKGLPTIVQGARILIVDDNPVSGDVLREQLECWGFEAVVVDSGAMAVMFLQTAKDHGLAVDVVLIDHQLRGETGAQVARLIMSDTLSNDTGIVLLTALDMSGDDQTLGQHGMNAHLMKPARSNLLRNALIEVARSKRIAAGRNSAPIQAHSANVDHARVAGYRTSPDLVIDRQTVAPSEAPESLDVLIAEDNEINQIVFSQTLQAANIRFKIVGTGEAAIEVWQSLKPELIIMDVSMPVMNGHQATRIIRERERSEGLGAHVPIIGVTAHALDSDRQLCLSAGMDDYLTKPISPETLVERVAFWARRKSKAAAPIEFHN
ncbi:PAS domain-containing protein [Peteryoungia desertarenae]|uniref:histidine kinase n=1 Tax=Peteryoungia desertarenae TaxID=1813451 RepID=A0ABX6QIA0_9HYPH|nr:PAS domain-containing protein [Peteryoungia desertarenae]QLF68301.1 PAS domain-containing protein [Peteryoungia desertarenae]